MFFAIFVLILGFAGYIASKRFNKVEELAKEYEKLLTAANERYSREIADIKNLKENFEKEKEVSLKLLFPLLEAQWFFYQGDFEKTIMSYKKAQLIQPNNVLINNKLNKILVETGRIEEAIKNLEVSSSPKAQPSKSRELG